MDWSVQFFFWVICASGLVELCYSDAYPNLETAQRYEICVIGRLSRSTFFSMEERSQMSKILKETGVRMHDLGVDPSNASNARTMLRLFAAALADLVFDADNPLKRPERKQNYTSALELCSKLLSESAGSELISEVSRIFSSMENKKSHHVAKFNNGDSTTSSKIENSLDKSVDTLASEDRKSKKRVKRSYIPPPQSSGAFQTNPPLDAVIAGVLVTSPSFGRTFKSGLTEQDAIYYSMAMVEAGLQATGYDYAVIGEALNGVTNAMSTLVFMPQAVDYAFAISGSINTVLGARGLANFADGIDIANGLISKLENMTDRPNPAFSVPSSFDSVSSSSVWDSGTSDIRQEQMAAPFQLNPSWDTPPISNSQFESIKKDFDEIFPSSNRRFPLNPSFTPNPTAPLPALDFGHSSVDHPAFSSSLAEIPFQQATLPASRQFLINPESIPSPFPVDQFSQERPGISNQPISASKEESTPFRFDNTGSQDFSFTSFVEQVPPLQPDDLNPQLAQAAPLNPQTSDNFALNNPQSPKEVDTFNLPPVSKDGTSSSKDLSITFDQTPFLTGVPEQVSIPSIDTNPLKPIDISFTSDYLKTTLQSSTTLEHTFDDSSEDAPDPYIMDVTSVIDSTLGLSEEFSSNFNRDISQYDAASLATAMTRFALSQYDSSIVSDVETEIENAVYNLPGSSSSLDYAHAIAGTFIKAMVENDLLNSVNSKNMADSLLLGLKEEINRLKALTDVPTSAQSVSFETDQSAGMSDTSLPVNGEESQVFIGSSIPMETNVQESDLTLISDVQTQQEPVSNQPNINTDVQPSNLGVSQTDVSSSGESSESRDFITDSDLAVPLEPGPFVSGSPSVQLRNESLHLDTTTTTTTSPLDVTETSIEAMTLSSAVDSLYSTFVTTEAGSTIDPYIATFAEAVKNPEKLFGLVMDEIDSSLKALNQTPMPRTVIKDDFIPVTTESNTMEADSTNSEQLSSVSEQELQPTLLPVQDTSPGFDQVTESTTEDQFDEPASLFAQRVSSIATSTIAYIRFGNINIDELCGKLNVLAFMVDIPPVDNCTEISMIDYLLNVLNAVISKLRRN